ncbi:DUF3500 domain-containing protein [Streptomyces canus]|uniref:DUF3500 domain-containing protein n=1 Tax=Streptomyces canus TaxID=58343 RepID=UPI0037F241CA
MLALPGQVRVVQADRGDVVRPGGQAQLAQPGRVDHCGRAAHVTGPAPGEYGPYRRVGRRLRAAQQKVAIASSAKSNESMKAGAFSDNTVQVYEGLRGNKLTAAQKKKLLGIVEAFAGRAKADAAKVRMAEVSKHLADTYVTWAGGIEDDSAFYVRVHSPVVWVEVDCQAPGPLAGAYGASQGDGATQKHVHSIIRTPNGNDYGKELLRQHYLTSPHHQ